MKYKKNKSGFRPDKLKEIALKVSEPKELLEFLIDKFPDRSRTSLKSILAHKQITVEDIETSQFDYPLKRGQTVYINKKKTDKRVPPRKNMNFTKKQSTESQHKTKESPSPINSNRQIKSL